MPQVANSITINRPVSEVFRFAIDFNNAAQWQPDIISTHQTEEKIRVGVMVSQRRSTRLLGWRLDLNADILGYQPNKLLEYKGVLGRFQMSGRMEFSSSGGSTEVTIQQDIRMGFLYGIFGPLMRSTMSGRNKRSLQALKQVLESRSVSSSNVTTFHENL